MLEKLPQNKFPENLLRKFLKRERVTRGFSETFHRAHLKSTATKMFLVILKGKPANLTMTFPCLPIPWNVYERQLVNILILRLCAKTLKNPHNPQNPNISFRSWPAVENIFQVCTSLQHLHYH